MQQTKKRIVSLLLVLLLLFGAVAELLPATHASAAPPKKAVTGQIATVYRQQYGHSAQALYMPLSVSGQDQLALEEAAAALRQGMVERESEIEVNLTVSEGDTGDLWELIWTMALEHTGQPEAGDYLAWHWYSVGGSYSYWVSEDGMHLTFWYYVEYYTDAAQEAQVDLAVDALLEEMDLWNAPDYDKICGVYDWMCQNITYNYDNLTNDAYTLKYTAYAALIDGTAVCQGYASLLYRLLLELGIDNRVIAGIGNGGAHGWNIVELDGLYYNVDATWDAIWRQAGLDYAYFLLSDEDFADHTRDAARILEKARELMPQAMEKVPEERGNNAMASMEIDDVNVIGVLSFPDYGRTLPVAGDWNTAMVSSLPCRFTGSIYDRSLIIGAVDGDTQLPFASRLEVGQEVVLTDMEGGRYTYRVAAIHHAKHATRAKLQEGEYDLTIFVKDSKHSEYLLIRCQIGGR